MKQNFLAGLLGSVVGVALLLLIMNATGLVNAQGPGPQKESTNPDRITVETQPLNPTGGGGPNTPLGTTFSYQGQLRVNGVPYTGNCDLQFKLWNGNPGSGGILLATVGTLPAPTSVNAGLFTTYVDFGDQFQGDYRDIEPLVRCPSGSGSYQSLGAQVIYPAPYALGLRPGTTITGSGSTGLTVVSSGVQGTGIVGEANNGSNAWGVYGHSSTGLGVFGRSDSAAGAGVTAQNTATGGAALQLFNGGIKVSGAGFNTSTPVFIQQVKTGAGGNICSAAANTTVIDNALINGKPGAILIVTPNYGNQSSGGVGTPTVPPSVMYDDANACGFGTGRWLIYTTGQNMTNGQRFNVLAVTP